MQKNRTPKKSTQTLQIYGGKLQQEIDDAYVSFDKNQLAKQKQLYLNHMNQQSHRKFA